MCDVLVWVLKHIRNEMLHHESLTFDIMCAELHRHTYIIACRHQFNTLIYLISFVFVIVAQRCEKKSFFN